MAALPRSYTFIDWIAAIGSSALLVVSFPDYNLWPLAWIGLVPLLIIVARRPTRLRAFLLGWLSGAVFFYGSCHWLTFSMINYGGLPPWIAYLLLIPGPLVGGFFIGAFTLLLAHAIRKWGAPALFLAPLIWPSLEWARLLLIGQLWNAAGYSQAFQPALIQPARWGGVYLVGFLLVAVNAAIAFLLLKRNVRSAVAAGSVIFGVATVIFVAQRGARLQPTSQSTKPDLVVVAVQPNVPMDLVKTSDEIRDLTGRHISMSESALNHLPNDGTPRLAIWPESPMNFAYGNDTRLREQLTKFAIANQTAVLFNSMEAAPNDGIYNSAVLVNQEGSLIARYDKIRLMPFGEYVPLPRWMPGASLIGAIVGDFTPGVEHTLMTVGPIRMGVFICIESAYPSVVRGFSREGADVLVNISNDGYLGPTAVMRQHLANAVFRAVENGRPVLRVTNTGITAYITSAGEVKDATNGFQTDVRTWTVARGIGESTFYSRWGDVFAAFTSSMTVLMFAISFAGGNRNPPRTSAVE